MYLRFNLLRMIYLLLLCTSYFVVRMTFGITAAVAWLYISSRLSVPVVKKHPNLTTATTALHPLHRLESERGARCYQLPRTTGPYNNRPRQPCAQLTNSSACRAGCTNVHFCCTAVVVAAAVSTLSSTFDTHTCTYLVLTLAAEFLSNCRAMRRRARYTTVSTLIMTKRTARTACAVLQVFLSTAVYTSTPVLQQLQWRRNRAWRCLCCCRPRWSSERQHRGTKSNQATHITYPTHSNKVER